MKDWLAEFMDMEGKPLFRRIPGDVKKKSMLAASNLMREIDNIDPDEPPVLIKYNPEKHDKLIPAVEPDATEEETDDHQANGIGECLHDIGVNPDTADKVEKSVTASIFDFETIPWDQNNPNSADLNEYDNVAKNETPNKTAELRKRIYEISGKSKSETPKSKNEPVKNDPDVFQAITGITPGKNDTRPPKTETETPAAKKTKKAPVDFLKLPKSEKYPFFPDREEPPIVKKQPDQYFLEQVRAINEKIDLLFPGESLRMEGVPDEVYHATNGHGSTSLKSVADAAAKFKYGVFEPTKSTEMGSAVHLRVLQRAIFDKKVGNKPPWLTRSTNEYKAIDADNPDVIFLNNYDYGAVIEISDYVLGRYPQFFTGGTPEVSYWKRCERTGLILKSRIDYEISSSDENGTTKIGVDLKTTRCSAPGKFERYASDLGYHIQDALYSNVAELDDFIFIAVETDKSHLATCNRFIDSDRLLASDYCAEIINKLSLCYRRDEWPGYTEPNELTDMQISYYARQKMENF